MTAAIAISTYRTTDDTKQDVLTTRMVECVDSLIKNVTSDTRMLLVDDGSTSQKHHDVIDQIKNAGRVEVIRHESNGGVAETKNTCLRWFQKTNAEWGFLSDDDVLFHSDPTVFYPAKMQTSGIKHCGWWCSDFRSLQPIGTVRLGQNYVHKLKWTLGVFMSFHRSVVDSVGAFQVLPNRWSWEHIDWQRRCVRAGFAPYPLDFVGSKNVLTMHKSHRQSTTPYTNRAQMNNQNRIAAEKFTGVYLPL